MNRCPHFRIPFLRSRTIPILPIPAILPILLASCALLCVPVAVSARDLPAGVTILEDSPGGITFAYDAPDWAERTVAMQEDRKGTVLAAPGWTLREDEGAPSFPIVSIPIAVPQGGAVRVEVVSERVRSLGAFAIPFGSGSPHAPYRAGSMAGREQDEFSSAWAFVTNPGHVRDQRIVSLVLAPVRFAGEDERSPTGSGGRPGSLRDVEELTRATIRVTFSGGDREQGASAYESMRVDVPVATSPSKDEALYRALSTNHETGRAWRAKMHSERSERSERDGDGDRAPASANAGRAREDDSFSSSPDWLKITVSARGMTRVTYQDFLDAGLLNPRNAVGDPRGLRMYTGTARELPESITEPRATWMDQTAILVAGGDDGTFDPGDAVEFYALPPDNFADYFNPDAPDPDQWVFHRYADDGVYWLTWGGDFAEPAARMESFEVDGFGAAGEKAFDAAGGGSPVFRDRAHFEIQEFADITRFGTDFYFWDELTRSRNDKTYRQPHLVHADTAAPGVLRIHMIHDANERANDNGGSQDVRFTLNDGEPDSTQWVSSRIENGAIVSQILIDSSVTVTGGENRVRIEARRRAELWLDWIEIFYDRFFEAIEGTLAFSLEPGSHALSIGGVTGTARVFDVSDRLAPREWRSSTVSGDRLQFAYEALSRTHAIALDADAWIVPSSIELTRPADLRAETEGAEYVAITGEFFFDEIETLVRHRSLEHSTYIARMLDIFDVYAWGLRDPVAIRDFLASAYRAWSIRPLFVLLAGDATTDIANRLPTTTNRNDVPTLQEVDRRGRSEFTFGTDDFYTLVYPDTADDLLPDLAIGRLPAQNEAELFGVQKKIVDYDIAPPFGTWKNETLMLADDHLQGFEGDCAFGGRFTEGAEEIANGLPVNLEKPRIYLTEYTPRPDGEKPEAQADLLSRMDDGFLFSSYVGRGGFDKLADENLLSLASLQNSGDSNAGSEYLFTSWTSSVGSFDLQTQSSLSERLLFLEPGGAVAAYGANGPSFANLAERLSLDFFDALFPAPHETIPLGLAAMIAKANSSHSTSFHINARKNHLLGDPAMELAIPRLAIDLGDTLTFTAGTVSSLAGTIVSTAGDVVSSFSGEAILTVHEMSDTSGFLYTDSLCTSFPTDKRIRYTLTGEPVYTATLPVVAGRFATEFVVPVDAAHGSLARVSAYAFSQSSQIDASGGSDSARIAPAPLTFPFDDADPPRVMIAFEGFSNADPAPIKLSTPIEITVQDSSGVNILQSDPFYQMHVRVDGGEPIPLLPFFAIDPANFRTGRLRFTLAALVAPGTLTLEEHELTFVFSDARKNRSETVRRLRVIPEDGTFGFMQDILSYPNPFDPEREESVFYTDFGSVGELTIEIFTVNGRRIRTFRECIAAGAEKLNCAWDGRDADGDIVANGVYVVRATAVSADGSERDESLGRIVVLRQGDRRIRR